MEANAHFQSLLQIQQGTTTDLENSLRQEKALTNQLQLKLQSSQRLNTEAQQKMRVFSSVSFSLGSWREN